MVIVTIVMVAMMHTCCYGYISSVVLLYGCDGCCDFMRWINFKSYPILPRN